MKIVLINEELHSQMQIYLALCDRHSVEIAEDEETALRLINEKLPDLVVLDLGLPSPDGNGWAGLRLLEKVKRQHPHIRVVTIINEENEDILGKASTLGVNDFIRKPIRSRRLMEIVGQQVVPMMG